MVQDGQAISDVIARGNSRRMGRPKLKSDVVVKEEMDSVKLMDYMARDRPEWQERAMLLTPLDWDTGLCLICVC